MFHEGNLMRPIWTDWIVNAQCNQYIYTILMSLIFIIVALVVDQIVRIPIQKPVQEFVTTAIIRITDFIRTRQF